MDIRQETCVIVRRGNEYLVGKIVFCNELRWSLSRWDAWRTRDLEAARRVARKVGGEMRLFNPIVGQERALSAF